MHFLRNVTRRMMPAAMGLVVQGGLADARIGKIVGGVGLTLSGASLIGASGGFHVLGFGGRKAVQKNRGNCLNREKLLAEQGKRVQASLGMLTLIGGIYQIITGVCEFSGSTTLLSFRKSLDVNPAEYNPQWTLSESPVCSQEQIARVSQLFLSCQEAHKRWDAVHEQGAFDVVCVADFERQQELQAASTDNASARKQLREISSAVRRAGSAVLFRMRRIVLAELGKTKMLTILLNAIHQLYYAQEIASWDGPQKCLSSADQYARALGLAEYQAVKNAHDMAASCIAQGHWPQDIPHYQHEFSAHPPPGADWTSFAAYLASQKSLGRPNHYEADWNRACRPAPVP